MDKVVEKISGKLLYRMLGYYDKGYSTREIATFTELHIVTVRLWLKRVGILEYVLNENYLLNYIDRGLSIWASKVGEEFSLTSRAEISEKGDGVLSRFGYVDECLEYLIVSDNNAWAVVEFMNDEMQQVS